MMLLSWLAGTKPRTWPSLTITPPRLYESTGHSKISCVRMSSSARSQSFSASARLMLSTRLPSLSSRMTKTGTSSPTLSSSRASPKRSNSRPETTPSDLKPMSTSTSLGRFSTTMPVRISPVGGLLQGAIDLLQQGSHRMFGAAVQPIVPAKHGGCSGITHTTNGTSKNRKLELAMISMANRTQRVGLCRSYRNLDIGRTCGWYCSQGALAKQLQKPSHPTAQ